MTKTTDLYNIGLLETMCFQGVNQINYWYMKNGYLYHCDQTSQTLHRKLLGQKHRINLYSSTVWEAVLMAHRSSTILYTIGLYETMCFQITKEDNYNVDTHGNRWRMFNGELEYYTGIQANSGFMTWASVVGD